MPNSKQRRVKAKQAGAAGGVDSAPPQDTAAVRGLRDASERVETDQGVGAEQTPGPGTVQLQEGEKQSQTIRLRNGTEMDAREALIYWDSLDLRWRSPKGRPQFDALAALVLGKTHSVPEDMVPELQLLLGADRSSVKPAVKAVLLACYEETPQGPRWHPLVEKNNLRDNFIVEVQEAEADERMKNLVARLAEEQKGRGGRGGP
jgi:hypothetical protein